MDSGGMPCHEAFKIYRHKEQSEIVPNSAH